MTSPIEPEIQPSSNVAEQPFSAYTALPVVEAPLEQYLGARSKIQMPSRHRDNWVRYLPWAAVILLPLNLLLLVGLLGVTAWAGATGSTSYLGAATCVVVLALYVAALPGLFKRTRRGWALFVYAITISAVGNLINLSIFGLAISAGLFWVAFQVKYHYR